MLLKIQKNVVMQQSSNLKTSVKNYLKFIPYLQICPTEHVLQSHQSGWE